MGIYCHYHHSHHYRNLLRNRTGLGNRGLSLQLRLEERDSGVFNCVGVCKTHKKFSFIEISGSVASRYVLKFVS